MEKCNRTACTNTLERGFWKIWNLGVNRALAEDSYYRCYCPKCGRAIIDFNRQELAANNTVVTLDYERVKP